MDNKELVQRVTQLWNGGDPRSANEIYADDCIYRGSAMPDPIRGRDALTAHITHMRKIFPDLRLTADEMIAEGDRIAVRWTWTGTHKGEWEGVAPTGRKATEMGLSLLRLRSGKIVDEFVASDRYSLFMQLGLVPARPVSAKATGH